MKRNIVSIAILLVLALAFPLARTGAATPWLHTNGSWIQDPNGNNVTLRGVSIRSPKYFQYFNPQLKTVSQVIDMTADPAASWYTKVLRLPCSDGATDPIATYFSSYIDPYVQQCVTKGMYVIVDLHLVADYGGTTGTQQQQVLNFWNYVAPKYANTPNVIFEVYNEPINNAATGQPDWASWKAFIQPVVTAIRNVAPNNLIVMGSPSWSTFANSAVADPIAGGNITYTEHIYPYSSTCPPPATLDQKFGTAANTIPVFMTEFGFENNFFGAANDFVTTGTLTGFGTPMKTYLEAHKNISWTAWCFDNQGWWSVMFDANWGILGGEDFMGTYVRDWLNQDQNDHQPSNPAALSLPIQVNAGGPAASPFIADVAFSGGTVATNWTGAVDTSAVTSPAPQAVYQSERYGASTYTFTGLTAGQSVNVRLHFCENYLTASGLRKFNVAVNSISVLSNFDIYATAGASHKANIQQFTTTVNGSGQVIVAFTNVTDNALVNGIEVLANNPPLAPTGLAATAGNAQVALSWTASSGATAYDVKRSTVSGSGYATVSSPTTTSYTNTGLTNGTAYYFVVAAKNAAGSSANSSQASATPSAPIGLPIKVNAGGPAASPFITDAAFSGGTVATNWTGAIDTSAVTSPAPQAVYQSERYGASTYTFTGLTVGQSVNVRLHFCENFFTATAQRTFNVSINGTSVLSNFDIYAATGAIHKANVQQFTASVNTSGQVVIAFTNVVNNALINGIEVLAATAPPVPTGLTATPGNAQVALSWTASSGATAYDVKRSTVTGSGYVTVSSPTTTSYTNTGLTNGTAYYFVVAAKNAAGPSANSAQASATPVAPPTNTHSGTWAAKGVFTGTPSHTAVYQDTVAVTANTNVVASFWIKGTGVVSLYIYQGSWGPQVATLFCTATSTWQQFTTPVISTGANTLMTFNVQDDSTTAGTVYVDDCFLGVSGGANVLPNPGFESGNVTWSHGAAFSILQNP